MKKTDVRHYITFDSPDKDSYTVPEIYDLARKNFNFVCDKNKDGGKRYRAIVKQIRRALEDVEPVVKGGRKTSYSKQDVQWLLNEKLYTSFLKEGKQYEAYMEEQKQVREFFQGIFKEIQRDDDIPIDEMERANELEEIKMKKKQEIVIDYICKHLIRINESKLEEDISVAYTADPNLTFEDSPREYIASIHLQDLENYYEILYPQLPKKGK